jgi:hypothetical protein
VVAAAKAMDLEQHRKVLMSGRNSPQVVADEISALKNLQAMKPIRRMTLVLDPKRGYAVVDREEFTAAGKRIVHFRYEGWKHYEGVHLWLPSNCDADYYTKPFALTTFSDTPVETLAWRLTRIEFGSHPGAKFQLDYRERGSVVYDRTLPEAATKSKHEVVYEVGGDGTALRQAGQAAMREASRSPFWLWANIAVLGVLITIAMIRHMRRARARS